MTKGNFVFLVVRRRLEVTVGPRVVRICGVADRFRLKTPDTSAPCMQSNDEI
jgi:hypothetical protein